MKILFLILCLSINIVHATNSYAQSQKLNLNVNDETVETVLKMIENQSEFTFFYNTSQINIDRKVKVSAEDKDIFKVLDQMFTETDVAYTVFDKSIILSNNKKIGESFATEQNKRISGTITDSEGEPIIGASVVEKGSRNGVMSDVDGGFSISVPVGKTIQITFIGYIAQEIVVTADMSTHLNITLQENDELLDDVIVVGYGTQKKEVITGAISNLKSKDISLSPSGNMIAGLAGRLSGVIINTRTGEAGNEGTSIRIRGQNTFTGSNDPLYVIDGIVRSEEGGILSRLDPEDIESISVLKDASAAIYGSRAANGVILVTTKRGKAGQKPTITLTYNHSFSQPTRLVKMANSHSYAIAQNLANEIRGLSPAWTDDEIQKFADGSDPQHYPNTNWYKEVQKSWSHQDKANLQLTGGSERFTYLVSAGLLKQGTPYKNGAMKNDMYNLRSNIDAKVNDYIKITFDLFGKYTERVLPRNGSANDGGIYSHIGLSAPTKHAIWPGTNYAAPGWGNDNALTYTSGEAGNITSPNWVFNGQTTIEIKLPWVKGMSVGGSLAYDYFGQQFKQFENINYVYRYHEDTNTYEKYKGSIDAPQLYIEEKRTEIMTGNVRINYLNTFNNVHTVDAFVGFEQSEARNTYLQGRRSNFPTGALKELSAGDANTQKNESGSGRDARQNYFGRVQYDYDNKYMLQFQFRYDGSQNFPKGERFGFFPGVSGGWTISRENFMQNLTWLDNLKLRGSWGKMGNDAVNNNKFQYMTMYTLAGGYVFNGTQYQGISKANTPNPNITWETAETYDIGLETRFLKNRLTFEFDWFKTKRSDILAQRQASIPSFTGLSLPQENIGKTENKGVEFMLGFRDEPNKDFSYSISGNFTYAKNKIIYMDETPMSEDYQKREGKPIGAELRYQAIGIYSAADIADASVPKRAGTVAGDIKLLDANGDGQITDADRIRQDLTNIPDIIYGLNINLTYKQFDLMLGFQGQARAIFYLRQDWVNPSTQNGGGNILQWWTEDTMTSDNPNGTKPRLGTAYGIGGTTFTQRCADFFKLKNAELGYNVPRHISSKMGLEKARVYLSGTNLFSIDSMHKFGIDPEATYGGWTLNPMRLINIGFNISF
ncbi:TonB-dependent receptor [Prevotella sp. 10(H)]|uniref:TonB-dependent receptor n=1 Tax=Prevotella sp. 10(H) TaxID=1158294 RepID=UPI0004A7064F|nr:TonB-dependent receptor [Prevotella sp. 10(H)]